jgi:cyclophilin family peptidyl-prolyl cis-trans isomerase/HEAT repeat protein
MRPGTLRLLHAAVLTAACLGTACVSEGPTIKMEEDRRVGSSHVLRAKLSEGEPLERARAARAMGRIQTPLYLDAFASALDDEDRDVRLEVLFAIGQLGLVPDQAVDARAGEMVLPLLAETDPGLVAAALNALGKLSPAGTPDQVTPLLSHTETAVRAEAAFALFRCRFAPLWRREVTEPPILPDVAVQALIGAMRDVEADVRFAATYAFSRYSDSRAREALIAATTDSDERVRLFAVRGLGHVVDPSATESLVARWEDLSASVRVEAVGALGRGPEFDSVERVSNDSSFHVRVALAQILGNASSASSMETLRRLGQDATTSVRVAAIDSLALRLGADLAGEIKTWVANEDWRIRAAAARAAGRAGDAGLLQQVFADPDLRVRAAVLTGLSEVSAGDEIVTAAIASDDLALRGGAVPLVAERAQLDRVGLLAAAYDASGGDDWIEVRESIADALAEIDGAETTLRRMLAQDPAPSVRGKVATALSEAVPAKPSGPQYPVSSWIDIKPPQGVQVDLETGRGTMRIELFSEKAPIHVAAFLERVDAGFYDGLIWHRVVSNFVIQGGDPRGDGWGSGGESLRDEIGDVRYGRGTLGMPKAGKDTGGCQLFITHVPTPHLDGNYTVFGQVVEGLEVIDAIEVGDAILRIRRAEIR